MQLCHSSILLKQSRVRSNNQSAGLLAVRWSGVEDQGVLCAQPVHSWGGRSVCGPRWVVALHLARR